MTQGERKEKQFKELHKKAVIHIYFEELVEVRRKGSRCSQIKWHGESGPSQSS